MLKQSSSLDVATHFGQNQNMSTNESTTKDSEHSPALLSSDSKNGLNQHMYRRAARQNQYEEGVNAIQVIVEDVERKIDLMQKRSHSKNNSNSKQESYIMARRGNPCSLDVIRKEVKAALQKVSSSTDIPSFDGRNLGRISNNNLRQSSQEPIVEEFEGSTVEEATAISELKKARQMRGDFSVVSISPNKKHRV